MNKFISRLAAALSAAVLSVGALGAMPATAETTAVTVHFNCLNDDSITFSPKINADEVFADVTTSAKFVQMPAEGMNKEGLVFAGWTYDGDLAYKPSSALYFKDLPEGITDVTLEPVFYDGFKDSRTVTYDFDKEVIGMDVEKVYGTDKVVPGNIYTPKAYVTTAADATCYAVTDGKRLYDGNKSFIMPDEDIVLRPVWTYMIGVTYAAGDVDRINGNSSVTFNYNEGMNIELASADRFSRTGFEITGWTSSFDGEVYNPVQTVTLPHEDVTFTAVWTPIEYTVVFNAGTGKSADNIKIKGITDTSIVCPELTAEKAGYYFDGWSYEDKVYQPGQEFVVPGAMPGLGIALKAVWKEGTKPVVEPTTAPPTDIVFSDVPGDANNDGIVNLNDAVAILQYVALPEKYPIPEELLSICDVYEPGSGVSPSDALAIQMYDAKVILSLPYYPEQVIVIDDPVA